MNELAIIAKELRQECNYISSPVIKKRLKGWAARLEAIQKDLNSEVPNQIKGPNT